MPAFGFMRFSPCSLRPLTSGLWFLVAAPEPDAGEIFNLNVKAAKFADCPALYLTCMKAKHPGKAPLHT
jgi:hypothetical protein